MVLGRICASMCTTTFYLSTVSLLLMQHMCKTSGHPRSAVVISCKKGLLGYCADCVPQLPGGGVVFESVGSGSVRSI